MDIDSYSKESGSLELKEILRAAEEDRIAGKCCITLDALEKCLDDGIDSVQ